MKINVYTILLVIAIGSCCPSCRKDWFDVQPETSVLERELFKTEAGFKKALDGVYISLSASGLYGKQASFGLADVLGGNYLLVENTEYEYAKAYNYENASSKAQSSAIWIAAYNSIANANQILKQYTEGTATSVLSEQGAGIIKGESFALRAFLHFDLLRFFGKNPQKYPSFPSIPYVTVLKKELTPQSSTSEVLAFVMKDLDSAAFYLKKYDPIVTGNSANPTYVNRSFYLNYYAVRALMARAQLYAGNKQEAENNAQFVINNAPVAWATDNDLSKGDRLFRRELLFNIYVSDMYENITPVFTVTSETSPSNLFQINSSLFNDLFSQTDVRRASFKTFTSGSSLLTGWVSQKYVSTSATDSMANRIPLIRITEMYLIAAEAEMSQNNAAAARDLLNTVLAKRKADAIATTISGSQLSTALEATLLKEYRREFVGEGQLFFFYKRRDEAARMNTQYNVDFILPLPDAEYDYGKRVSNK